MILIVTIIKRICSYLPLYFYDSKIMIKEGSPQKWISNVRFFTLHVFCTWVYSHLAEFSVGSSWSDAVSLHCRCEGTSISSCSWPSYDDFATHPICLFTACLCIFVVSIDGHSCLGIILQFKTGFHRTCWILHSWDKKLSIHFCD
jgi:hypothetical protein